MDYKSICVHIWQIERDWDLFSKKIGGVYFWKIVRFYLVRRIAQERGVFGQDHTNSYDTFFSKAKYALGIIIRQRRTSTITRKEKGRILIFDHDRKLKVNGEYIDIYTHDFISRLNEDQYEVVEKSYMGRHLNKTSENRSYEEYISFFDFVRHLMLGIKLTKDESQYLDSLKRHINSLFDSDINIKGFVTGKIKIYNWKKNYYDKLLRIRQPSAVYLVTSYANEPLIAACREKEIEVIEIQHGTMSRYHLGYSFPQNTPIPYFPDKMVLYGKYWYDSTPLPISEENVSYKGFPYLRDNLMKYRDRKKEKNTVLFISQGTIGKELSAIARTLARVRNDYTIIYKLHPGEFGRWRREYPDLVEADQLPNFTVVENAVLHELQAVTEYQIGVYSTAIFEGLMMECKTILMRLNGIVYMEFLLENEYVRLAEDGDDLLHLMGSPFSIKKLDKDYFFFGVTNKEYWL